MKAFNPLARLEAAVQGLLERAPARLFGGQLQPVELAKRLAQAMESERSVAVGKVYVPNHYTLHLHPEDYKAFEPYREDLERELASYLRETAKERNLSFRHRPVVQLCSDGAVRQRGLLIQATIQDIPPKGEEQDAQSTAALNLAEVRAQVHLRCALLLREPPGPGRRVILQQLPFRLGRSLDSDLVLEDGRVSRHHAQIVELYGRPFLVDLGSTNGSFLNGEPVTKAQLKVGDVISLGGVELTFELEG